MPSSLSAFNFVPVLNLCSFHHILIRTNSLAIKRVYNPAMFFEEFRGSLSSDHPLGRMPPLLAALWWEAKGDWAKAHEIAQEIDSPDAAWVHAYLHRKEGDQGNAGYWYRRAGKPHSRSSFDEEWEGIARTLLKS